MTVPRSLTKHGCSVLGRDGNGFEIAQRPQVAETANHVFCPAHFEQASADFIGAAANFFDDRREGNAVGAEFVRIDVHLILTNESANARHLSNSRDGFKLIPQIPVLNAAQVGEAVLMAVVYKDVLVDPSGARRVWTDDRMHAFREPPGNLLHVLQDSRPRPVQIGAVLENNEDVGISEHRLRSHGFDMWSGEKRRDDWVRHLVLDDARRFAGPGGMYDHFHVRDVRQRVERNLTERPDSREPREAVSR